MKNRILQILIIVSFSKTQAKCVSVINNINSASLSQYSLPPIISKYYNLFEYAIFCMLIANILK